MDITVDQARALDAVSRFGTFQKAAEFLCKGHSAVMYLIKSLEEETQLTLLDRSGYRNKLTAQGGVVLKYCQQILLAQEDLSKACLKLQNDWEPNLKLVYDGVINFDVIGDVLGKLNKTEIPTEVKVSAAYLNEVEQVFEDENADLMLTILPIKRLINPSIQLKPLKVFLVVHESHELARMQKGEASLSELNHHTFISVKETASQLGLSTEHIEMKSSFVVRDFYTKKKAICKGLGYGWLPEYLIKKELEEQTIRVLNAEIANEHLLYPRLYHRGEDFLGKTAEKLLTLFKEL